MSDDPVAWMHDGPPIHGTEATITPHNDGWHSYPLYDAATVDRLVRALADKDFDIVRLRGEIERLQADAARYRWLRDTFAASVGGGITVNDEALVYEEVQKGCAVRVYWYPDTPIGFYEFKDDTLDAAIDAAMKGVSDE